MTYFHDLLTAGVSPEALADLFEEYPELLPIAQRLWKDKELPYAARRSILSGITIYRARDFDARVLN